jgi:HEAT repeat protein
MGKTMLVYLALAVAPAWADANGIKELFQAILGQHEKTAAVSSKQFFSVVNENTVRSLSPADIEELLPLARRSLQSSSVDVRRSGVLLLMAIGLRPDSAGLLEPYVEDLEVIAGDSTNAFRQGALYILGSTKPNVSAKVAEFLAMHLGDKSNSQGEKLMIAASLLRSSSDPAIIQKTLKFVDAQSDTSVKAGVLMQLGALKTRNTEAVAFIGRSLESADLYLREAAVDCVGKLDVGVRANFINQLKRIAEDPKESSETRSRAESVMKE